MRFLDSDALVRADGLALARALPEGCCDLVYLDPPFGSGVSRRTLKGRGGRFGLGEDVAFADPSPRPLRSVSSGPIVRGLGGLGQPVVPEAGVAGGRVAPEGGVCPWLAALLEETRRVLRPGGALFLHLDYRSVHHARLLLDRLFGADNLLNEIIWHYATGGIPARSFARKHDTILYYRNGPGHTFHRLQEVKRLAHRVNRAGVEEHRDERGWYRYRYLDDVWEIPWLTQDAKERTGYPTQKPLALLERILRAATDPGMRVADFCCGSGTTAVAAAALGRRWIACDQSDLAIRVARERLTAAGASGFEAHEGIPAAGL